MLKAKITMLLSDKRPGGTKKKNEKILGTTAEQLPVPDPIQEEKGISYGETVAMGESASLKWNPVQMPEKNLDTIEDEERLQRDREALKKCKPVLRPKCLVGEATGREYTFSDQGITIGEGFVTWNEIDVLIAELQAIKMQRIA